MVGEVVVVVVPGGGGGAEGGGGNGNGRRCCCGGGGGDDDDDGDGCGNGGRNDVRLLGAAFADDDADEEDTVDTVLGWVGFVVVAADVVVDLDAVVASEGATTVLTPVVAGDVDKVAVAIDDDDDDEL